MRKIEGILLEPVGCLAEFPSAPFHEIAVRLFGRKGKASKSGSRSYWHCLNLMEAAGRSLDDTKRRIRDLECEAVAGATVYEDVAPALVELRAMGVAVCLASSLSRRAVRGFLGGHALEQLFSAVCDRDSAGGIKETPLTAALRCASLQPEHAIFLTDTAEGLKVARRAGVHPVLMMNDPDEAQRLALQGPAGGIVSLHELPDFMRLVRAQNAEG